MKSLAVENFITIVRSIWFLLSPKRRVQFFLILLLMVICSLVDLVSIGMVIPFLGLILYPGKVNDYTYLNKILFFFNIDPQDILFYTLILFIVIVSASAILRLALLWLGAKFSNNAGSEMSTRIFAHTLHQSYQSIIAQNSSSIIDGVINKGHSISSNAISQLLKIITAVIFISLISTILLFSNFLLTISIILFFGFVYFFIMSFTRKILESDGKVLVHESIARIKILQESIGGIRDVVLHQHQNFFIKIFYDSDMRLRSSVTRNEFISSSPRLIIEPLGIIFIVLLAYFFSGTDDRDATIPVLGAIALAIQKILPLLQQAYGGWSTITSNKFSILEAIKIIREPLIKVQNIYSDPLNFLYKIKLHNISFKYTSSLPLVLNNINLEIIKGQKVGIIGKTGSGKSTLIDVIMGLLQIKSGCIYIDNLLLDESALCKWKNNIAHVPQSIFLSDATILENIAFGEELASIDFERVQWAAKLAHIDDFVSELPSNYLTVVGERGVRFSGGQRQRIGIARALYRKASLLILDEATSSLDSETEKKVLDSIYNLNTDLTMIIIAHRISTLETCDCIYEFKAGTLERVYL
jgi:ABC-type multidrug transport system fused ATPase/permease subunit